MTLAVLNSLKLKVPLELLKLWAALSFIRLPVAALELISLWAALDLISLWSVLDLIRFGGFALSLGQALRLYSAQAQPSERQGLLETYCILRCLKI